jgi:thioredoxin-related protein
MKKITWIIFVFLSVAIFVQAQTKKNNNKKDGVEFVEGDWANMLATAKQNKKPFWVDVYTTWCSPCKKMAKETFTDEEVVKFVKDNFLAYKIDAEKGEGETIAEKYNVEAYPTILIFSAEGKLLGREVGYMDSERFVYVLEKYKKKKSKN